MFSVYILFSKKLNRYYIGTTDNVEKRPADHNSRKFENAFTSRGIPWELYLEISGLESTQARRVESHIKSMNSKRFIQNLLKFTELTETLKQKYK